MGQPLVGRRVGRLSVRTQGPGAGQDTLPGQGLAGYRAQGHFSPWTLFSFLICCPLGLYTGWDTWQKAPNRRDLPESLISKSFWWQG